MSEPLVRVLRLIDGDKPAMGYLYEIMDGAKETTWNYYVGKGTPGHNRHMLLWDLIDSEWTRMLHRPIHAAALFLNPAFAYKCNFDFDDEVLEGLLTCIQMMVPDYETRNAINREIEVYRDGTRPYGFANAIRDKTIFMPGMLLIYQSVLNFNFYNFI